MKRLSSGWDEREEELEDQLNRGALWAIAYGDVMSYLMVFFLMLYVGAAPRAAGGTLSAKASEHGFTKDARGIQEMFSRSNTQKIAHLEISESKIRIVLQAPVLFDSGEASLRSDSLPILQEIAQSLSDLPNSIQIEGHTDDRPLGKGATYATNWELSAARAFAVLRFLETKGIAQQRLSAIGYGEFRPAQKNDTPEGRAANRRIDIDILRREN